LRNLLLLFNTVLRKWYPLRLDRRNGHYSWKGKKSIDIITNCHLNNCMLDKDTRTIYLKCVTFLVTGVCWANIEFDQRETNIVSSLCVVLWSCLNSFKVTAILLRINNMLFQMLIYCLRSYHDNANIFEQVQDNVNISKTL
jgi:hypothetical protein